MQDILADNSLLVFFLVQALKLHRVGKLRALQTPPLLSRSVLGARRTPSAIMRSRWLTVVSLAPVCSPPRMSCNENHMRNQHQNVAKRAMLKARVCVHLIQMTAMALGV